MTPPFTVRSGAAQEFNLGSWDSTGSVSIPGTLTVAGLTTLAQIALTAASLSGNLTVAGNATVGGTLGVTGATATAALTASGAVTANGGGTGLVVTNDASVGGNLAVTGNVVPGGVGQRLFARKASDTTRTNTTTAADDPDLTVSLAANSTYVVRGYLRLTNAAATADFKGQFSVPAGATTSYVFQGLDTTATAVSGSLYDFAGFVVASVGVPAGNAVAATVTGIIRTAGTAGAFTLQWAQNTIDAVNGTAVTTDSWILAERVA